MAKKKIEENSITEAGSNETPDTKTGPSGKSTVKTPRKSDGYSQRWQKSAERVNKNRHYPISEALKLAKETSYAKFNASIEVHYNLGIDITKDDQKVRTTVVLPCGTGKEKKILAFVSHENIKAAKEAGAEIIGDEAKIEGISKGIIDFDVVVSDPAFMPKLSKVAKILGPKGLMPNPKAGTVTPDPVKAVRELKKGRIELRCETNAPILHTIIGKVSFSDRDLYENFTAVHSAIKAAKPSKTKGTYIEGITLSATMGPPIKVELTSLA